MIVLVLLVGGIGSTAFHPGGDPARRAVVAEYAALPLAFEPNRGQAPAGVRFLSQGNGYTLMLGADRLAMLLGSPSRGSAQAVAVGLPGARTQSIERATELPACGSVGGLADAEEAELELVGGGQRLGGDPDLVNQIPADLQHAVRAGAGNQVPEFT